MIVTVRLYVKVSKWTIFADQKKWAAEIQQPIDCMAPPTRLELVTQGLTVLSSED